MAKVRLKARKLIYQGRIIKLFRETLIINGREIKRETIKHPGAVVVIPILPDGRIVFVRQYRRAIDKEILELPAGTLEPGEPRAACAKRELEEETGWKARKVTKIGQFYAAPGFISEQMTLFLAQGLTLAKASPEPDEMVRPVILSLPQALKKVYSGSICDAKTIIGLLFAKRLL